MNETNAWKNIAYSAICCNGKWKWFNNMGECIFFIFTQHFWTQVGPNFFSKAKVQLLHVLKIRVNILIYKCWLRYLKQKYYIANQTFFSSVTN